MRFGLLTVDLHPDSAEDWLVISQVGRQQLIVTFS